MPLADLTGGPHAAATLRKTDLLPFTDWRAAVLLLGIAALLIPTLLSLATRHWSISSGAHGPLILISGTWLIWRERHWLRFQPGGIGQAWLLMLVPLLPLYAFGRGFQLLGTESAALYAMLVLLGFYYWGPAAMRRLWFAVLYLAFLIKPPYGVVAELTQPLKIALSELSVDLLHALGYPIGQSGVLIQIAQYELMVEQACAGLSSLVTLFALGLLYIHLTRPPGRMHAILLLAAIVPIAMVANLLRVIILVLLTYHAGDAVAQSVAHDAAGVVTFSLSMLGMFLFDQLLDRLAGRTAAE